MTQSKNFSGEELIYHIIQAMLLDVEKDYEKIALEHTKNYSYAYYKSGKENFKDDSTMWICRFHYGVERKYIAFDKSGSHEHEEIDFKTIDELYKLKAKIIKAYALRVE